MLNLDKISENISTKNYKDDISDTNVGKKIDSIYEGLSHRLSYMDRKFETNTIKNQVITKKQVKKLKKVILKNFFGGDRTCFIFKRAVGNQNQLCPLYIFVLYQPIGTIFFNYLTISEKSGGHFDSFGENGRRFYAKKRRNRNGNIRCYKFHG